MARLCWWVSGKPTWHNSPIVPPILHVYQNKFADQTLACFPIGPWPLIGSQGLCWGDYGSKLLTLASISVLQPWMQRFRGAPHMYRPRGAASKEHHVKRKLLVSTWRGGYSGVTSQLEGKTCHLWKQEYLFFLPYFMFWEFSPINPYFTALIWILFFGTISASKWKLLDYPLRATVSFTTWGIYLLIPSTWNNLDELNLLIAH